MRLLTPSDHDYYKIVTIHSVSNYDVDCTKLTSQEAVQCPMDKDMTIGKTLEGAIILKKKSFLHPFSK